LILVPTEESLYSNRRNTWRGSFPSRWECTLQHHCLLPHHHYRFHPGPRQQLSPRPPRHSSRIPTAGNTCSGQDSTRRRHFGRTFRRTRQLSPVLFLAAVMPRGGAARLQDSRERRRAPCPAFVVVAATAVSGCLFTSCLAERSAAQSRSRRRDNQPSSGQIQEASRWE
jgi:hypothetical protein